MCTMCAPRDRRKSSDNQCGQAELNVLRCRRWTDVLGAECSLSASDKFAPANCRELNSYDQRLSSPGAAKN